MQLKVEPIYKYRYAYQGNNDKISIDVSMHPEVTHLIGPRTYIVSKSLDSDASMRRATCIEATVGLRRIFSRSAGREDETISNDSPILRKISKDPGILNDARTAKTFSFVR